MASIRDVAERANVAACTVSRVLNGTGNVSEKTKSKIMKAMEELDYVPNALARGMFMQRSGIIAMLVPSIRHPFFSSLANFIETELFKKGYKLMLCATNDDVDREKEYLNTFKSNIVDGVIFGANNLKKKTYEEFGKPMVMLDLYINDGIPVVVSDHKEGGRLAANEFIHSACKHVLHLCSEKHSEVLSYASHAELDMVLGEQGIDTQRVEIKWNEFDYDKYLELAGELLSKRKEVDGIMAPDMAALAFAKAAIKLGKRIPEDICIVAYDGTYIVNTSLMNFTTIKQPLREIATKTVEQITAQINGEKPDQLMCKLRVSLQSGDTTK